MLSDQDSMPFGKYKGKPMEDVPASYLDWLRDQPWLPRWPDVQEYIQRNEKTIDWELERQEED